MYRWQKTERVLRAAAAVLVLVAAAGCASSGREGEKAADSRDWDAAVYHYLQALAEEPDNVQYRMGLVRARQRSAQQHFQRGLALRGMGRVSQARDELMLAVQLDPTQQFAEQELAKIEQEIAILEQPGGVERLEELKRQAREAKVKPPVLDPGSKEQITLSFPKQKPIKEIYQAIAKAYGFNVLFDPKLKDDKLSIELAQVTAERALEIVMQAAGHFYKVLDPHSIIVVEDTPQNRREYEDLVIKTFFLSNADVKEVDKLLRSLIEARRLATNEQLNAITLRDTADKVAIAEKLIATNDKARAEVVVDVELLLVASTENRDFGATLSTWTYTLGLDTGAINPDAPDGTLGLDDIKGISRGDWFINVPSITIALAKSSGLAEVLAEPQLRISEGEKASLHIGDRVPIPVTSFNTQYTGGSGVIPITSFQYQDVGIKIDVEPRVHHNREVTMKLTVEVSNLGEEVPVGPSQTAVTIGTRTITSVIRLRSGESSLLAGLFRRDTAHGEQKTPILSDIPVLGRLFTLEKRTVKTTDLVLTLTPHIVRFPDIQEEDLAPVWVGTESKVSFFGGASARLQSGRAPAGPFDRGGEEPSPDEGGQEQEKEKPESTPTLPRSRPTPFGVRQLPAPGGAPEAPQGGSGMQQDLGTVPQGEGGGISSADVAEPKGADLAGTTAVGVEPSVLSIASGEATVLRLATTGGFGPLRLSVGLSFDPQRLAVEAVTPAPGVAILDQQSISPGWLSLDLVATEPGALPPALATLAVRALQPGATPLTVTSDGAVDGEGTRHAVSTHDGAMFVVAPEGDR